MIESIHEIIRKSEQNYTSGTTKLGEYVDWSMHDTIERIFAYLNSKHMQGDKDALGRDKPFFNIVTAARNVWYRATDIDRKDIIIRPDNTADTFATYVLTLLLQDWMKRERFGVFLNQWGRSLADYGSVVVKFVKKEGRLIPSVVPWNRLIVDPVDFYSLPVIEKFYRTPAQLRANKQYDQEIVEGLIASVVSRKTIDGDSKDNQNDFIELYEVHGELPIALLKEDEDIVDEDETTYRQQIHVVSFTQNNVGTYNNFTLYQGKEENPYMITHLIEEDGRTLSIGAVESLFDPQWMVNHSMKNMKDTTDLASKLIFQSADPQFVGRNILSSVETGDILTHSPNNPLTQANTSKVDITSTQAFADQWRVLGQEITSTPDAIRGNTMPSGTPFALGAFLGENANSLFEIMVENKALALEDMLRMYIIPHFKTKLDNKDEVMAVLNDHQIRQIDSIYLPNEAIKRSNEKVKQIILSGGVVSLEMQDESIATEEQFLQKSLADLGDKRPIKPDELDSKSWKEVFKDMEMKVEVGISNESVDKRAMLTTLATLIQTIGTNPAVLQDPNVKLLFNKTLSLTGAVSPVELSSISATPPVAPEAQPAPTAQPVV